MNFADRVGQRRFLLLFISLTLLLTVYPVIDQGSAALLTFQFCFQLVILTGLFAMRRSRLWLWSGLTLAVPAIAVFWLATLSPASPLRSVTVESASNWSLGLYLIQLVLFVLRDLFSSSEVTNDRLFGALSAYILLGVAWGFLYTGLELGLPGSFHLGDGIEPIVSTAVQGHSERPSTLFYFSFVTLTTLGYGDISPIRPFAQMLVTWEAILGQAYLTILVARLVGLHLNQHAPKPS